MKHSYTLFMNGDIGLFKVYATKRKTFLSEF